jgi:argininosuccinate lyase
MVGDAHRTDRCSTVKTRIEQCRCQPACRCAGKLLPMNADHDDKHGIAKPWEHAQGGVGSTDDPLAVRFVASLEYDRRLYRHDIAGSLAHARMLCDVKLINADELAQIEQGLAAIQSEIEDAGADYGAAWPGWKLELEDVHMCIEAALIEKVGDAGRKLHTGRSRNDQVALDLKLWMHEASQVMARLFGELFAAFVGLAQRQGHIVMPAYTHLQRAQPIVVGGELMAWLAAFDRAERRIANVLPLQADNPLGSGAIAGSSLELDRHAVAEALPLAEPSVNSIDATATRDAALDFVYGLAMTAMTLSRLAEQWILYASTEFGFIELDRRYTTGSSMMPQKQNPDMLELIRGRCGGVYGNLMALLAICKSLPIGYNRDLQEDKRHLFDAYDSVSDCLAMAARIVATARFNEQRISASLDDGFIDATSLADYLVSHDVPFRTAHQMVGSMVRRCREQGLTQLLQLTIEQMNGLCAAVAGPGGGQHAAVCSADVYDWLGAANVVKRYCSLGNAGVSGFAQQLDVWQQRLRRAGDAEATGAAEPC